MVDYINEQKRQEIEAQKRDNLKWIAPISAGLGAIGLGAYIFKTGLAKQGGNIVGNLLHFLGRPNQVAVNVDKVANSGASEAASGASGIRSWLTSTFNLKTKEVQLGPIDLIIDLGASLEILGETRQPISGKLTERLTEHINRRFANRGNNVSFFSQNLERVTAGYVLDSQAQWAKLLGQNQWDVLKKSVDLNLISRTQELDASIFKTNKGFLRDLRIRNFFTTADENGKLVPKLDFFGQWGVFKSWLGERQGVARLGDTPQVKGSSFFIGGNVYAYSKNPKRYKGITETLVQTGQKLRLAGDRLEPIRAAREGRLEFNLKQRTGLLGRGITAFEQATGVGTSFQNRFSFLQRWVTHPIKRLHGLATGKAIVRESRAEDVTGLQFFINETFAPEFPELVTVKPKRVRTVGKQVPFADLTTNQKIRTLFGWSDRYTLVTPKASQKFDRIIQGNIVPHLDSADTFIPRPPTEGGVKLKSGQFSEFYTAPQSKILPFGTSTKDLASYLMYRTSHLASETLLGISFAPAKTLLGNAARLAAVPVIYETGRQLFNYADYVSEKYTGVSPVKAGASLYTFLREKQQAVRGMLGIQQTAAGMENNFPGSVDSELATLIRSAAAPAGIFAAISKYGSIGKAVAGAAATYALIGGPGLGQTAEALKQEYAGEIKVPVRKGRWWGIGTQPFGGGDVERFDYSWYHKLMRDPKTKSIYGSQDEYWKYHANVFGVPLPTPSNMFGFRNLANPYRLEEINQSSRPYEQTSSGLEEFPIFGPMLASTFGKVLKPTVYRAGLVPAGLTVQTARDLGMPDVVASDPNLDSLMERVNKMGNIALEPLGLYKFVMEYFGLSLEPKTEQLATSNLIDSPGKNFYAMNLGGALGQSEFLRRFMLSDYSSPSNVARMVNRVPNDMPDWVPGSGSRFSKDRSYYLNFSEGNPFDKLAQGEARLPGKGYEAVARLESNQPGVYSDLDRFLILSDVAPYSEAYAYYDKIVSNLNLSPGQQQKVALAREYQHKMTSVENRYPRYTDSLIGLNEHIQDSAAYKVARRGYDHLTHDFLAEIPLLGSKLAPFRDPYEKYRKQFIEGSEFASWYTPWEDIQRPALIDIALSNPAMGAIKGGTLGLLLSSPALLGWASPVGLGPTSSAAGGALAGAAISIGRLALGVPDNYVPDHVIAQSETIQYLDALNYTKNRALELAAIEQGVNPKEFTRQRRKTLVGSNTPIMLRASLPTSSDKKYFDAFLETPGPNREELLAGVSPHMSYALTKAWNYNYAGTDQTDQEAVEALGDRGVPAYDSLLWHPSVDNKSMGLKIVEHGLDGVSDNYHKYGFYESHEATLRTRLPDLWNESVNFITPPKYHSSKDFFQNMGSNIAGSKTSMFSTPFGARYTQRLQIDRSKENLDVIKGR